MAMFQLGMNPTAVREVASSLGEADRELVAVAAQLDRVVQQLKQTWGGPDASAFQAKWTQDRRAVADAAAALRAMGRTLDRNVEAQDRSSEADGSDGGAGEGSTPQPNGAPGAGGADPAVTTAPDPLYENNGKPKYMGTGYLDPDVAAKWPTDLQDREDMVRKMKDDLAEKYGITPPPEIRYASLADNRYGEYHQGPPELILLNDMYADDPTIAIGTTAHEMRHAYQAKLINEYTMRQGPWNHPEVSEAEIVKWMSDDADSRYHDPTNWRAYANTGMEEDARKEGQRYVRTMSENEYERISRRQ